MTALQMNKEQLGQAIASGKTVLVDFWAPWCTYCRRIESAYEEIARTYGDEMLVVKLNMDEDEALWQEMNVELIPTIRLYRDGEAVESIVAPESKAAIEQFLSEAKKEMPQPAGQQTADLVIIGGGPAGYTAALYAVRAGLDAVVVEKLSAGGQMAQTHQVDNYPGFADGVDGYELAEQMKRQAERFGAKSLCAEVTRVDLHAVPKVIETSEGTLLARTVVIATGANPRELGLPDEKALVGRGVAYCAACDGMFYRGKTVAVVGGGNSAAADALLLSRIAQKVILIHRRDTLRATKVYHDPLLKAENVEFRWNSTVAELLHGDKITGVKLRHTQTGEEDVLPVDGVFVSVGRKPATELFRGQLALDEAGYIIAPETTETSVPGVYAVGDVRQKPMRQIVTAVADGAVAVHMAEEYLAQK